MTVTEAKRIIRNYYRITTPSSEESFLYTEALSFLIEETRDPKAMVELGGYYYGEREFDLALKYYEMAAESGDLSAISSLGYIWYYGRTGEVDYEKAFSYFDKARKLGDIRAAYKIADMYKNGYFVEKDYEKYKAIVEELYPKVKNAQRPDAPLPEIYTRLAKIRSGEGKTEEALALYDEAKDFLAQRIRFDPFFGDLNIMKWMIGDIYKLREFDEKNVWLYDLYYLLEKPVTVRFKFEEDTHEVEAVEEEGGLAIRFDGAWYRTVDDFFRKAGLDGEFLTLLYEELYDFEVI